MKHLQTYTLFERVSKETKLFESVSDDAYEKWLKAKTEYDAKISELKSEYLEGVKQCMFDLTDNFDHTSKVILADNFRPNSGGDLVAKFKFKVTKDRIDEFFDTLEELEETVKSYISQYRRIQVSEISFRGGREGLEGIEGNEVGRLHHQNPYSLKDIRKKVKKEIEGYESYKLNLAGIVISVEI